ncbi:MAG: hypothetical protein ACOC33_00245 [bacterium]
MEYIKEDKSGRFIAYHGSAKEFDKFDISRVGSGMDIKKFGFGLYFAENKETALYYAKELSIGSDKKTGFNLYKVELRGNYFDWEQEMPQFAYDSTIEELRDMGKDENADELVEDFESYGDLWSIRSLYEWLTYVVGGEREASEFLFNIGIDGVIGQSPIHEGDVYVAFNDENIKIINMVKVNDIEKLDEGFLTIRELEEMDNKEKSKYSGVRQKWLPQVSAPYTYIVKGLEDEGVDYRAVNIIPARLNAIQKVVDSKKVDDFINILKQKEGKQLPIFVTNNNEILDGVYRFLASYIHSPDQKIPCIKINRPANQASMILNKLQDKYDFENKHSGRMVNIKKYFPIKSNVKVEVYRENPISKESKSGNFFELKQRPEHKHKFVIEFDNLYEFPESEITNYELPTLSLAQKWAQGRDVTEMSLKYPDIPFQVFINRFVAQMAKNLGFDGIKYGDRFIQVVD